VPDRLTNLVIVVLLTTSICSVCLADEYLRDPTRPYSAKQARAASAPRFVVNAIIVSAERRVAIVNGQRVGVGGSVGNATVVSIEKDQLVLETNGKQMSIRLHEGAARQ